MEPNISMSYFLGTFAFYIKKKCIKIIPIYIKQNQKTEQILKKRRKTNNWTEDRYRKKEPGST